VSQIEVLITSRKISYTTREKHIERIGEKEKPK